MRRQVRAGFGGRPAATGLATTGLALAGAGQGAAAAPPSAGSLLEEVTVTAQRREEAVQDVPVAVSAFTDRQLARQNANNFAFFDVERVEILRGPQGTLFGRNTTGGAVNVILKKPGTEFGGVAEAGVGQYGGRLARVPGRCARRCAGSRATASRGTSPPTCSAASR
ncbi:MAG: TonB-dependent receptor plug domain-containing protein [Steroidobacteraceae bacterium]|nr:TonB-dependent receptor plug domain-containing protein [Steroidobacteraceae bacterium]